MRLEGHFKTLISINDDGETRQDTDTN
jgi:hypothetical protein